MKVLTDLCHSWGLSVGADLPIALEQQHSWFMTDNSGESEPFHELY